MKKHFCKLVLSVLLLFFQSAKAETYYVGVWDGYWRFVNFGTDSTLSNVFTGTVQVNIGDTIKWLPVYNKPQAMPHTITADTIPMGAASFNYAWDWNTGDTLFTYTPIVTGYYKYRCVYHSPPAVSNADMSGRFFVLPTIGIHTSLITSTILSIVNGKVKLNDNKYGTLEIYNSGGSLLAKKENTNNIDISTLSSGIYFVNAVLPNQKRYTLKFVR